MIRTVSITTSLVFLAAAALGPDRGWAAPSQISSEAQASQADSGAVVVPAGTQVSVAVTAPVWAKTAKAGDPVYTQTNFPVTVGSGIAIPAGTYVEDTLVAVTRPTKKIKLARLQIALTKIIFANGYTIALPAETTLANVTVQTTTANDLLLDNGAQFQMKLAAPLTLDAAQVASAIPVTRALTPGQFKTATLCRNVPATAGWGGMPGTVIPGSAGTPSVTIPGGPGMPDTVIPGTPATPDTVIPGAPGSPGTPAYYCPAPPMVISSSPPT